jgi:hypothetical protein
MPPEIKVSNCCGDRLVTINDPEGTGHYECFACKKPCDGVQDCADCFPHNYPVEEYKNQTVPLCERHANQSNHKHCWLQKGLIQDHMDCEKCCGCDVKFNDFAHDRVVEIKPNENRKGYTSDELATLIGSLILHCGNLYNENGKEITVEVARFIKSNLK